MRNLFILVFVISSFACAGEFTFQTERARYLMVLLSAQDTDTPDSTDKCHACDGKGYWLQDGNKRKCLDCNGTGTKTTGNEVRTLPEEPEQTEPVREFVPLEPGDVDVEDVDAEWEPVDPPLAVIEVDDCCEDEEPELFEPPVTEVVEEEPLSEGGVCPVPDMQGPVEVEIEEPQEPFAGYEVLVWGGTYCSYCVQFERNEEPKLVAAGVRMRPTIKADLNKQLARQFGVSSVPVIDIIRTDGNRRVHRWVGYTKAATILSKLRSLSGAKEQPVKPVTKVANPVQSARPVVPQNRPEVVNTPWGRINLRTYSMPGCNCSMCQGIRKLQQQHGYPVNNYQSAPARKRVRRYRTSLATEDPTKAPCTPELITQSLQLLGLTTSDMLADCGCGDARVLIEAVERYGCRAVGIEIDPDMVAVARSRVEQAGLSDRIQIYLGDVREFDYDGNGVTAVYSYLYPDLLAEMTPVFRSIGRVATPWHEADGLGQRKHGDVYLLSEVPGEVL